MVEGRCADCDKPMARSKGSLPPGQGRCRPCRRKMPKPYGRRAGTRTEPLTHYGDCEWCKGPLDQRVTPGGYLDSKRRRFCSVLCANRAQAAIRQGLVSRRQQFLNKSRQRNLRHAETWDGISDEEIYERDGWKCQLCRRKINASLKFPRKGSKSIDHIVPLSRGGDDTSANKRAAHLGCNMVRRNRIENDQLLLFGSEREPPLLPRIGGMRGTSRPPAARSSRALALRNAGRAWDEIAEAVGYRTARTAQTAAKHAADRGEPVGTVIYYYECRYCGTLGCQQALGQRREVCPDPLCQKQRLADADRAYKRQKAS